MLWTTFAFISFVAAEPVTFLSADPPYTTCMESVLSWRGGVPPYALKAKVDGNFRMIQQYWNDTTYKFVVDSQPGRRLDIFIEDASGENGTLGQNSLQSVIRSNEGHSCPLYVFPADKNATWAPATVTVTSTPSSGSTDTAAGAGGNGSSSKSRIGEILGIIGGVVAILIILGLLFWIWRLRKRLQGRETRVYETVVDHTVHPYFNIDEPSPVGEQAPLPSSQPPPNLKTMQLSTMLNAQFPTCRQPQSSFASPGQQVHSAGSPAVSYPLSTPGPFSSPPSSGVQRTQHYSQDTPRHSDQDSEYAEDAGPAFPPPPRTVHPPHYRDTWKS